MKLTLTKGTGTGRTMLSSFDAALWDCGVSNYNLIFLSSIIPAHAQIVRERYITPEDEYGWRLYAVRAEIRSEVEGEYIGAGIGWCQGRDGRGLFVEHESKGENAKEVERVLRHDITRSLSDLRAVRGHTYTASSLEMELNVASVRGGPTCVIVLAVYASEPW